MTTFFDDEKAVEEMGLPQRGLRAALAIGGLDPSGGAGLVADARTFTALGVHPMAVAATITYQSTLGVEGRFDLPAEAVVRQLEALFDDRVPNAVKTGALGTAAAVEAVASFIRGEYSGPLVVDPVAFAGEGGELLDAEGTEALIARLLPLATMVTPNAAEASRLSGFEVRDVKDAEAAALRLISMGARSALVTGLEVSEEGQAVAADVFCDGDEMEVFTAPWVAGLRVHGTGCVLSAALAALLAEGSGLADAVRRAREFTAAAIRGAAFPGRGSGCADPQPAPEDDEVETPQ